MAELLLSYRSIAPTRQLRSWLPFSQPGFYRNKDAFRLVEAVFDLVSLSLTSVSTTICYHCHAAIILDLGAIFRPPTSAGMDSYTFCY